MTALAEAVRRHWPSYAAAYGPRIPVVHRRAAQAILRCRHFGFLSAAARTPFARVRSLLHAGEISLVLPPKPTLPCPCCGKTMTFLRCDRARGPPLPPK